MSLPRATDAVLTELSASAKARIKAAEVQLGFGVKSFIHSCIKGEVPPDPTKLEPLFEEYSVAVFDVESREQLSETESPEEYRRWLQKRADRLLNKISARKGVWWRVVKESLEEARISLSGDSGYIMLGNHKDGYRSPQAFIRPQTRLIRGALRLRLMYWHNQALEKFAAALVGQDESRPRIQPVDHEHRGGDDESKSLNNADQKRYKTALGRNIDRLRLDCGWSLNELENKTGLDKKLIIGHITHGKGAHPKTLKKYAEAFSRELHRNVTSTELKP